MVDIERDVQRGRMENILSEKHQTERNSNIQNLTLLLTSFPIPDRQVATSRCVDIVRVGMIDHDSQVCTTNSEIDVWAIVYSKALERTNV